MFRLVFNCAHSTSHILRIDWQADWLPISIEAFDPLRHGPRRNNDSILQWLNFSATKEWRWRRRRRQTEFFFSSKNNFNSSDFLSRFFSHSFLMFFHCSFFAFLSFDIWSTVLLFFTKDFAINWTHFNRYSVNTNDFFFSRLKHINNTNEEFNLERRNEPYRVWEIEK